jgi:hypothetical protein
MLSSARGKSMRRLFLLPLVCLFLSLVPLLVKAECTPQSRDAVRLICYHYDPQHPYIVPKQKVLYRHVLAPHPICGSLSGGFFRASQEHTHAQLSAACNAQIPSGHGLLKMAAADKRREYTISFDETTRENVFKRIVVFGDSLSEEGSAVKTLQKLRHPFTGGLLRGLAKLVGCTIPHYFLNYGLEPYWNGMFSNGPMWPRYLSDFLGHVAVENLAFAGATTGPRKCRTVHLGSSLEPVSDLGRSE